MAEYALRPLATPKHTLEGAFRVHISAKDPRQELNSLGLRPGDLCRIASTDGSKDGLAIAWPSSDRSEKRHVKISDAFKEFYGFDLQQKVTLACVEESLPRAESVSIREISRDATDKANIAPDELRCWVNVALLLLEAVVPGGCFDVEIRRGARKGLKRRFIIEEIQHAARDTIYECGHDTVVNLQQATTTQPAHHLQIDAKGIGGLQKQLDRLNERLQSLMPEAKSSSSRSGEVKKSRGILLHGPSGTGKALVLDKFASLPCKTVRLNDALGPSTVHNQEAVRKLFGDARTHQPSVILIDDLEDIAEYVENRSQSHQSLAAAIATEMKKSHAAQLLVVATTCNLNNVDQRLRKHSIFGYEIEIPVPDANARTEILKILRKLDPSSPDSLSERIGEKTHGFVGEDLAALVDIADDRSKARLHGKHLLVNGDNHLRVANGGLDTAHDSGLTEADFEDALREVRPTAMKEIFLETPTVRWSDIGGSDEAKKALYGVVERPFKKPELTSDCPDLLPQKGILLYGPPGCSKTLTAKALATESGLNFIAVKGAELTSMYVGESERAVREVFRKARAAAPSIIFFDEIDSIGSSRDSGPHTTGLNVLTTLLNEMDGIESLKGVLVLAATNKPEILDSALMRPGRFDTLLYIGPPNLEARKQILQISTRKKPVEDSINLDELAERTDGYSGAEIVRICSAATEACIEERDEKDDITIRVGEGHFEHAVSRVPKQITPELTARYEMWAAGFGFAKQL